VAPQLDAVANIFLGRERRMKRLLGWFGFLDQQRMRKETEEQLGELRVRIPDLTKRLSTFSGGQRQGVAVARAVMWASEVVIMDEPTAALGVAQAGMFLDLVRRVRQTGIPVMFISHNMPQVFDVADRVVVLRLGEVVAELDPEKTSTDDAVAAMTGSAIQANPDAILIAPTDVTAMVAPIQSAVNQDIPVVLVDTTIKKEEITVARISSDNVKGSMLAGEALAKLIGEEGKVMVISVTPGISTTDQRKQGFEEAIKKYPDIECLGTEYCNDDPVKAASITTATLRSNPDLKGIFGANVFSGQGAGSGIRQTGKKDQVSVVAFDATPTQVEDLRKGNVDGLIAQHPSDIGDKGVRIAVEYLKSGEEPAKKQITTGFTTATRENLDKPEVKKYLYKAEC
jgi:ribose transport system substrate-binding protein